MGPRGTFTAGACLSLLVLLLLLPASAQASLLQEKQADLAASQARLDALQAEIERIAEACAQTEREVLAAEASLAQAEAAEEQARADLAAAREELADRLACYYKESETASPVLVQVLFGSESLSSALNALPHVISIAQQDKELLNQVAALTAALELQQEELTQRRHALAATKTFLANTQNQLGELLKQAAEEHDRLKKEVAVLEHADQLVREAVAARERWRGRVSSHTLARARGFVFPVDGPHAFVNDWGLPRPDDRVHQGTDVMARQGASVVAVRSGVISRVAYRQPLGGTVIWLAGDDGTSYYYAHLARVAPDIRSGMRVVAGYPLGQVGDTGNARGGPPHLHFGMYPGGGGPVNPYLTLRISD